MITGNDFTNPITTFQKCGEAYKKVTSGSEPITTFDDMRAFAFFWTVREFAELGKGFPFTPDGFQKCHARLLRWMIARAQLHLYDIKVRCKDAANSDPDIARAAFAGFKLSDPASNVDPEDPSFLRNLPQNARKAFAANYIAKPKPRTEHYDLDCWLLCIWPVVAEHGWTYSDVLEAATVKFPSADFPKHPLDEEKNLAIHCRRPILNLRVSNKPGAVKPSRGKRQKPACWHIAISMDACIAK